MNWPGANSLDEIWRSPAFPMWLTLSAAGFFGIIVVVTLLRAEKSVANGALTVITLLAVGIAVAATIRGFGSNMSGVADMRPSPPMTAWLPAQACVDDLAGDAVLNACEKAVFGSPEAVASALSYAASLVTRLNGFGDVATANRNMTPELEALRRAVEQDRYGLMAQVLMARDHCTPSDCAAFKSLTDSRRITTNMDERTYENLIVRYLPVWSAMPAAPAIASLVPGVPIGRPTNAEFPSAASTPAVSIMTPEPGTGSTGAASASKPTATANAPAPKPAAAPPAVAAAKKPPAPKPRPIAPPTVPAQSAPAAAAPAPAASNE